MRRLAAILLVAWFSFTLIGPAFAAVVAQSNLPACCRRNGSHHCDMASASTPDSGTALRGGRCGFYPVAPGLPAGAFAVTLKASPRVVGPAMAYRARPVRKQSRFSSSVSRADQKRGPPSHS